MYLVRIAPLESVLREQDGLLSTIALLVLLLVALDSVREEVLALQREEEALARLASEAARRCIGVLLDLFNVGVFFAVGAPKTRLHALKGSLMQAGAELERTPPDKLEKAGGVVCVRRGSSPSVGSEMEGRKQPTPETEFVPVNPDQCPQPVRMALLYMEEHYQSDLTLTELAEIVNLSPSYFSTLFNNITSMTFVNYLTRMRISHAQKLLRTTNLHIYEIAEQAGYKNSYYFNRIFKNQQGITPLEYRNICGASRAVNALHAAGCRPTAACGNIVSLHREPAPHP